MNKEIKSIIIVNHRNQTEEILRLTQNYLNIQGDFIGSKRKRAIPFNRHQVKEIVFLGPDKSKYASTDGLVPGISRLVFGLRSDNPEYHGFHFVLSLPEYEVENFRGTVEIINSRLIKKGLDCLTANHSYASWLMFKEGYLIVVEDGHVYNIDIAIIDTIDSLRVSKMMIETSQYKVQYHILQVTLTDGTEINIKVHGKQQHDIIRHLINDWGSYKIKPLKSGVIVTHEPKLTIYRSSVAHHVRNTFEDFN